MPVSSLKVMRSLTQTGYLAERTTLIITLRIVLCFIHTRTMENGMMYDVGVILHFGNYCWRNITSFASSVSLLAF